MVNENTINLEHGKKFNLLREGLKNLLDDKRKIKGDINNISNQKKREKALLDSSLNALNTSAKSLSTTIVSDDTKFITRTDRSNPYINKLGSTGNVKGPISFRSLGSGGYVTNMGLYKPFPNSAALNATKGKNGCPTENGNMVYDNYTASMKQGSNMVSGQSCGNEGNLVYVNELISNPTSTYVGCFMNTATASSAPAMFKISDSETYGSCMKKAANNGYQYFGLSEYNETTNRGACLVGSNETTIKQYGPPSAYKKFSIWSSNTGGNPGAALKINNSGQLIISATDGRILWSTPVRPNCTNGGGLNTETLMATYGSNCPRNPSAIQVTTGNANSAILNAYNSQNKPSTLSFPVNSTTLGNPDPRCRKYLDVAYQCGSTWKKNKITNAENTTFVFNCTNEVNNCKFILAVKDTGNIVINKGETFNPNAAPLWDSDTLGKQKVGNKVDYPVSKSKYGKNFLSIGQTLGSGDWISSPSSNVVLIMEPDGNLVLYAFDNSPTCSANKNGLVNNVGIYKINEQLSSTNIGKIGFVDEDTKLHEFPSTLLQKTNEYTMYNNISNSAATTLGNPITTNDVNQCISACNSNINCNGFVKTGNTCTLKGSDMFPVTKNVVNFGTDTYIKQNSLRASASCNSKEVKFIDSVRWNNYVKGTAMTASSSCDVDLTNTQAQKDLKTKNTQRFSKSREIYNKTQESKDDIDKMNTIHKDSNRGILANSAEYVETNKKIKSYEGLITMTDAEAKLNDSEIRSLQENYTYIFWNMFAVGFVIATLSYSK